MKKYLQVGLILCAIGAISAGLIGVTNLVTRDTIAKNEKLKKENACKDIYKDATSFDNETAITNRTYCQSFIKANLDSTLLGYVYYVYGRNSYGDIGLMVGINSDETINRNLNVITNGQSFASTLVKNYINPFKDGTIELSDTKCGATFGAKLIESMVNEALTDFKERSK